MAILDLKEKIEPFRKNATGYVKQLLSADHVVMSDGTTLQTKMDSLNSALTTIDSILGNKADKNALNALSNNLNSLSGTVNGLNASSSFSNYQYVFKDPSGIMIIASSINTINMPADSALGGYSATSKFNVAFNGIPIPIVSSRYGGGIDVVSVKYISNTQITIGSRVQIRNFFADYVCIGLWK